MLWQRVLTALVLIPLVVAGVLYLDEVALSIVVAVAILIGAAEMGRLAQLAGRSARIAFLAAVAASLWFVALYLPRELVVPMQWIMSAGWVVMTSVLFTRRRALQRIEGTRPGIVALGWLVMLSAWLSIVTLHATGTLGPVLVLFLFVLIWVADSGAYFAGRAFGERKLSPHVSPGKTWAGVAGGLTGAAVCALLLWLSGLVGEPSLTGLLLLCFLVTLVSIGGDLWISRLKREAGVKDSGSLLPGHGGMLDRIDSLLAAAPVFGLGVALLGVAA